MCGIAGYFGTAVPDRERLDATLRVLRHRGPDGEGIYTHAREDWSVALLHRRLAILDLDARSDQPFRLEGHVLVFNGEIYNFLELRRDLVALGYNFRTGGDTEVLARSLLHWGEGALDKLEGMWAFAWYSERDGTLLLSRDRFGEKPLYLWRHRRGVFFASEVKGIAALAGAWPAVNEAHLIRYLINGYKALYKVPQTFFDGVEELPRATCRILSPGGKEEQRSYWNPALAEREDMAYPDAVRMVREAVVDSVDLRMRADVPLAFCMSGGVDSNTLISVARRELRREVHGFTIVNTDARYEEATLIESAVKDLRIRHTAIPLSREGFLENLSGLVSAHDAPVYTISYYVHWQLMKAVAAHGYKVTISGTGADELFTGYYDHHNLYLHEIRGDPQLYAQALAAWRSHQEPLVRNPHLRDPDLYARDPAFRGHIFLNSDVFSEWLHEPWREDFTETQFCKSLLRNRMLNELFAEAVPVILHEDDLNAMCFSMENRSPFLDRRLFELAYSVPSRHLIKDGFGKAVLRDAMRGIVPDAILNSRRKVGFNAPIMDLMDVNEPRVRSAILDDSAIYRLVRKDCVEMILRQETLPNSVSKFLFNFVNIKLFLEIQQRHSRSVQ